MRKENVSHMAGGLHRVTLLYGDCTVRMQSLAEGSVGAVVCDPPYG